MFRVHRVGDRQPQTCSFDTRNLRSSVSVAEESTVVGKTWTIRLLRDSTRGQCAGLLRNGGLIPIRGPASGWWWVMFCMLWVTPNSASAPLGH